MAFVDAYDKETGEKRRVPERWLGNGAHPQFKRFSKTPRQKAAERQAVKAETNDEKES